MTSTCVRRRPALAATAATVTALVLTACGSGTGPAADADLEEMDPVTLQVQSAHAPEAAPSRAFDAWKDAVEEASDGKIEFEMFYTSALAPIAEVEDALASGLIDIGTHAPMYNAARFPTINTIQALNSVLAATPLAGTLQGMGAQTALLFDDAYSSPFEEEGVQPLMMPMAVIPAYHLGCAGDPVRSLDEAAGKRVRVPGEHHGDEVEALGMVPTATTIDEIYESLERGVVDCIIAPPGDIRDLGLIEVMDHWVIDPEVMFTGVSGVQVSMSKERWDALPVAAQQILWDTAGEVFLPAVTEGALADAADAVGQASEAGVEFHTFEDDARGALDAYQQATITDAADDVDGGQDFVDRFTELHQTWLDDVESLGLDLAADDTFEDLDVTSVDWDAFAAGITEAREPGRP